VGQVRRSPTGAALGAVVAGLVASWPGPAPAQEAASTAVPTRPGDTQPAPGAGTEPEPIASTAEALEPRQAAVEPAPAQETPPELPEPRLLFEGQAPTAEAPAAETTWLDVSRAQLEPMIGRLVVWLDHFFGNPAYLPLEQPSSYFRLRGEVRFHQDQGFDPGGTVIADVRLPSLNRWLSRFSVSLLGGDAEAVAASGTAAARPLPLIRGGGGAVELRYNFLRIERGLLDLAAGVRLRWPPPPYVRLRWLQEFRLAGPLLLRISPAVFWELHLGFGEYTEADVNVEITPTTLWRTSGRQTVKQLGRRLEWNAETGVQQLVGPGTAFYLATSISGATAVPGSIELYRFFARFRHNLYRMWIFAELEPEIRWPVDPPGDRRMHPGVTLRLEVQFTTLGSGSGAPR